MPGPKMGPRPLDFDEEMIRHSPTFVKWMNLLDGQKLRYACRVFIKGHENDEERLMRRIMIARRNNLRDHETLKKARLTVLGTSSSNGANQDAHAVGNTSTTTAGTETQAVPTVIVAPPPPANRRRRPQSSMSDQQVEQEMDVPAVTMTRSYKAWLALPNGAEFVYNQKYIKGKEGHDWLLRKNIWRRMRYRRENKRIMERVKTSGQIESSEDEVERNNAMGAPNSMAAAVSNPATVAAAAAAAAASNIVVMPNLLTAAAEHHLPPPPADHTHGVVEVDGLEHRQDHELTQPGDEQQNHENETKTALAAAAAAAEHYDQAAVEAAVAVAADFPYTLIQNPLNDAALDAAAKLAIAASTGRDAIVENGDPNSPVADDPDDLAINA